MSRTLLAGLALSAMLAASGAMAQSPNVHKPDAASNPPTATITPPTVAPATTPGTGAPGATTTTDQSNDPGKHNTKH